MKNKVVEVPALKDPIRKSPGFAKKELSQFKLDLLALCGFGCRYCSSNAGNYLRINREKFAGITEDQLGERVLPADDPSLTLLWPGVLDNLERQLSTKERSWGSGLDLMFSMLTDGFSPLLVKDGITERALQMVLDHTSFRIRVLTKSAVVGSSKWVEFFQRHPGRFVVGLSVGSLDASWARKVEIGCSLPKARLKALRTLQDASVPTFGMLCPVFPDALAGTDLEILIKQVRPERVETFWAEPYNDRANWEIVREGYQPGSYGRSFLTEVYGEGRTDLWSMYATELFIRLLLKAQRGGWESKLRYLLYEGNIRKEDAPTFKGMDCVLLQDKPGDDGQSRNPHMR